MALTTDQWFAKLRSFVPDNIFEEEEFQKAHWRGIAAVLSQLQLDFDGHFNETFILQADTNVLNEHGAERSLSRTERESNITFADRVRNLTNQSNCPAIKSLVDTFLINGEATIMEPSSTKSNGLAFANRGTFLNRKTAFAQISYNTFSILVDEQKHAPYSFLNREQFTNREDFVGSNESSDRVFDLIVEAVNDIKALGILYRVIETTD